MRKLKLPSGHLLQPSLPSRCLALCQSQPQILHPRRTFAKQRGSATSLQGKTGGDVELNDGLLPLALVMNVIQNKQQPGICCAHAAAAADKVRRACRARGVTFEKDYRMAVLTIVRCRRAPLVCAAGRARGVTSAPSFGGRGLTSTIPNSARLFCWNCTMRFFFVTCDARTAQTCQALHYCHETKYFPVISHNTNRPTTPVLSRVTTRELDGRAACDFLICRVTNTQLARARPRKQQPRAERALINRRDPFCSARLFSIKACRFFSRVMIATHSSRKETLPSLFYLTVP